MWLQDMYCCSVATYVTGPEKTGLIYIKYTSSYYGTYLLFCIGYTQCVSFIEFLMEFCTSDEIFVKMLIKDKKLLHFKVSKLGQILCVDKTGFLRPSHIYRPN